MKLISTTLWLIFLIYGQISAFQKPENIIKLKKLDAYINKQMEENNIPGLAYVIVKDGEIYIEKAFGFADDSGRKITTSTPYELGSISKSFTAIAILNLAENNRIDLADQVIDYLPWFKTENEEFSSLITIRHLLHHKSGFSRLSGAYSLSEPDTTATALENLLHGFSKISLKVKPGTTPQYSNINYQILRLIIEKVTNTSFEDYIEKVVLQPLKMNDSFITNLDEKVKNRAMAHTFFLEQPVQKIPDKTRLSGPAASVFSSARDMGFYLKAVMNEDSTPLKKSSYRQIFDTSNKQRSPQGEFGWFRSTANP